MTIVSTIAVPEPADLTYGLSPKPVTCGNGLVLGSGSIYPEINFTLPPTRLDEAHMPEVRDLYRKTIGEVLVRAEALQVPGLVVEFELLPQMTRNVSWGVDLTAILREALDAAIARTGLKCALRVTPVDIRESRVGDEKRAQETATLLESFRQCAAAGADMLAIESTGGKEITDAALMECDLSGMMRGLAVHGTADVAWLWREIVAIASAAGRPCIASGDSACGFGNTAMMMAGRGYISRVFASVVRVVSAVRSLAAFQVGAVGPSKDCAYEGIICKAIAGVPIAMEGKSATFAHVSPIGNVAMVAADLWSNESIEIGRALSGPSVVASFEQLVYDCRLMNAARERNGAQGARSLVEWLCASDAPLDPQAYVLTPEFAVGAAKVIASSAVPYVQAKAAAQFTLDKLTSAVDAGQLQLSEMDLDWLDRLKADLDELPESMEE